MEAYSKYLEEALMIAHKIVVLKEGKVAKEVWIEREVYPSPYGQASKEREELLATILE